jgi:hypothetical protein
MVRPVPHLTRSSIMHCACLGSNSLRKLLDLRARNLSVQFESSQIHRLGVLNYSFSALAATFHLQYSPGRIQTRQ